MRPPSDGGLKNLKTILKEPLLYNDTDDVNKSGSFLCDSAKKQIEEEERL